MWSPGTGCFSRRNGPAWGREKGDRGEKGGEPGPGTMPLGPLCREPLVTGLQVGLSRLLCLWEELFRTVT